MIIKKITIEEYKKPFISKTFLGKNIFSHRKGWYIKIYSDEFFGIGESAPIPGLSLENHIEAGYALEGFIIALEKIDYDVSIEELLLLSDVHSYKAPSVKLAIQTAIFDLYSKYDQKSIANYFNKNSLNKINLNAIYHGASKIKNKDTNILKVKIQDGNIFKIRENLDNILNHFPSNIKLRLDFNGRLDLSRSIRLCKELKNYNIDYIEQPTLKLDDLYELRMISGIPIAVDELLTNYESLDNILQAGAADVLIIKPTLTGGVEDIKNIIETANKENLRVILTSSFETNIAQTFILHLIASLRIVEHCGILNINLYDEKTPEIKKDYCKVPQNNGLGLFNE